MPRCSKRSLASSSQTVAATSAACGRVEHEDVELLDDQRSAEREDDREQPGEPSGEQPADLIAAERQQGNVEEVLGDHGGADVDPADEHRERPDHEGGRRVVVRMVDERAELPVLQQFVEAHGDVDMLGRVAVLHRGVEREPHAGDRDERDRHRDRARSRRAEAQAVVASRSGDGGHPALRDGQASRSSTCTQTPVPLRSCVHGALPSSAAARISGPLWRPPRWVESLHADVGDPREDDQPDRFEQVVVHVGAVLPGDARDAVVAQRLEQTEHVPAARGPETR